MATEQSAKNLAPRTSRVGKRPVVTPAGVSVDPATTEIKVKGPKGELAFGFDPRVHLTQKDGEVTVTSSAAGRDAARLQGTARATIANMVHGVTVGYSKTLELVGTGYRIEHKGTALTCVLGFSHLIDFPLPPGITAEVPKDSKGTILTIFGSDKALVGQTAATIRGFRPPEPYGGKGVRYKGEKIREKAGKAGK